MAMFTPSASKMRRIDKVNKVELAASAKARTATHAEAASGTSGCQLPASRKAGSLRGFQSFRTASAFNR